MSAKIISYYDDFVDYVADGYASYRGLSKPAVMDAFKACAVDSFLINAYHPLARHNRKFIARKIDGYLLHHGYESPLR